MDTFIKVQVEKSEIDKFEHVNNGAYVNYLEKGRRHWYPEAGLSVDELSNRRIGTVILRLKILYKKELTLGEIVHGRTTPAKLGSNIFVFKQDILNKENEVVTEATVLSVMVDSKTKKSITVADEIAKHFK